MPNVNETAYPRLKSHPTGKELASIYTPNSDELAFSNTHARRPGPRTGFLILLKTFQRLLVQARQNGRSRALTVVRFRSSISATLQMGRLKRRPSMSSTPITASPCQSFGARESTHPLTEPSGIFTNKTSFLNTISATVAMAASATIMSPIPISRSLVILFHAASGRQSISLTAYCRTDPRSNLIRSMAIRRHKVRRSSRSPICSASNLCPGFGTGGI